MSGNGRNAPPGEGLLRRAGFVPLPRLWVKPEERELIIWMAEKHFEEVDRIRKEARAAGELREGSKTKGGAE